MQQCALVDSKSDQMGIVQQIQKRMLVSLAQIAKQVDLKEGDRVIIEERDGGIFLRPVALVDKRQAYIWSKEWQDKLRTSDRALEKGEYKTFANMDIRIFFEQSGDILILKAVDYHDFFKRKF